MRILLISSSPHKEKSQTFFLAKEVVIILLAHQLADSARAILTKFNLKPDKKLEGFARFALDEYLM